VPPEENSTCRSPPSSWARCRIESSPRWLPGRHDRFITTLNQGKAEWWPVKIVGVTSPTVYQNIVKHGSYSYIASLMKAKNKNVTGVIPTDLFCTSGSDTGLVRPPAKI
jgi:hypothetical protein